MTDYIFWAYPNSTQADREAPKTDEEQSQYIQQLRKKYTDQALASISSEDPQCALIKRDMHKLFDDYFIPAIKPGSALTQAEAPHYEAVPVDGMIVTIAEKR